MTPEALAALHARCFAAAPPPWSAQAFADLIAAGGFLVEEEGGFALGRVIGPEAELLTIAVAPEARRRGIARRLLAGFEARAAGQGAEDAWLEVAEGNEPARALYAGAGWLERGRRRRYYGSGPGGDAILCVKRLGGAEDG